MKNILIIQILEEFEMKITRLKISEKKFKKDIEILKEYCKTKVGVDESHFLEAIKKRNALLLDTQNVIIEFQQNKNYFKSVLNN
jgi:hypothetical protein